MNKDSYVDYGYVHQLPRNDQIELRRQLGKPLKEASVASQYLFYACLSTDEEIRNAFERGVKFDDTFADRLFLALCAVAYFCESNGATTNLDTFLKREFEGATESMKNRIISFCSCEYSARGLFPNTVATYLAKMKKDGVRINPATFESDLLHWGDEKFDTRVKYGKTLAGFKE